MTGVNLVRLHIGALEQNHGEWFRSVDNGANGLRLYRLV